MVVKIMTRKKSKNNNNNQRSRKRLLAKAAVVAVVTANATITTLVHASNTHPSSPALDDGPSMNTDNNNNGNDSIIPSRHNQINKKANKRYRTDHPNDSHHNPKKQNIIPQRYISHSKLQEIHRFSSLLQKVHETNTWTEDSRDILRSLDERSSADFSPSSDGEDGRDYGGSNDNDGEDGSERMVTPIGRKLESGTLPPRRRIFLATDDDDETSTDITEDREREPNLRRPDGPSPEKIRATKKKEIGGRERRRRRKLGRGVGMRRPHVVVVADEDDEDDDAWHGGGGADDEDATWHDGGGERANEEDCYDLTDLDIVWNGDLEDIRDGDSWGSPDSWGSSSSDNMGGGASSRNHATDEDDDDDDEVFEDDDDFRVTEGAIRWAAKNFHQFGPSHFRKLKHHNYYYVPYNNGNSWNVNAVGNWRNLAKSGKQSKTYGYAKSGKMDAKGGKNYDSHNGGGGGGSSWNRPNDVTRWSSPPEPKPKSADWWSSPSQDSSKDHGQVVVVMPKKDVWEGGWVPQQDDDDGWGGATWNEGGGTRSGKAAKGGKDAKASKGAKTGTDGNWNGNDDDSNTVPCFIIKEAPAFEGYCGLSAADAASTCGTECGSDGGCPGGQGCYDVCGPPKYCGLTFDDAATRCAVKCEDDRDCPGGESCFDGITEEDCPDDVGGSYCGETFGDASVPNQGCNDGDPCGGGDCPEDEYCFAGVTTCPAGDSYCGNTLADAEEVCAVKCSSAEDCPGGQGCYDGVETCDLYAEGYCGVTFDEASTQCNIKCSPDENRRSYYGRYQGSRGSSSRAFSQCPNGQDCFGGVTTCPDDGNSYCGVTADDAAVQCLRACSSAEDCPRNEFCYDGVVCGDGGPDPTPGPTSPDVEPPGPTPPGPTPPPTPRPIVVSPTLKPTLAPVCVEGCIDCDPNSPLPCPPVDMKRVCDSNNDELYPPGTPRQGELVANFVDCYDMCKPSFCCIHDSTSLEYSPSCSNDINGRDFYENCPLYYPCYVIWWKLSDTIGPATYMRLGQDDPFYENLNFEFLQQDWGEDKEFFQQFFGHHFDGDDIVITDDTFENRENW